MAKQQMNIRLNSETMAKLDVLASRWGGKTQAIEALIDAADESDQGGDRSADEQAPALSTGPMPTKNGDADSDPLRAKPMQFQGRQVWQYEGRLYQCIHVYEDGTMKLNALVGSHQVDHVKAAAPASEP